jgi:hypothetical protein
MSCAPYVADEQLVDVIDESDLTVEAFFFLSRIADLENA